MLNPSSSNALAVYLGVVQLFFAATWTLYVIYLPQLAQQAGIGREWVPWILVADQVVFAIMDVVTGFWVDRVRGGLARLGGWILGVTAVSCAAFLALPFLNFNSLVAAAIAPYLGIALRGVDPRLPFVLSTLTLLATVSGLVYVERRIAGNVFDKETPPGEHPKEPSRRIVLFFVALLVMAAGFQVHFSLNSAPQYLRFASQADLPYLMPVFWIGFNVLMFPASGLVKRLGAVQCMAIAAAVGALATFGAVLALDLKLLLAAQFVTGGCWGAASVAAYCAVIGFGRAGREGRFLGALFAALAIAAFARIAAYASDAVLDPQFRALLPWIPGAAWLLSAGLLFLAARSFRRG